MNKPPQRRQINFEFYLAYKNWYLEQGYSVGAAHQQANKDTKMWQRYEAADIAAEKAQEESK